MKFRRFRTYLVSVLFVDELAHHDNARLLKALAYRHPRRRLRSIALVRNLTHQRLLSPGKSVRAAHEQVVYTEHTTYLQFYQCLFSFAYFEKIPTLDDTWLQNCPNKREMGVGNNEVA